jgi:hypothetical protein
MAKARFGITALLDPDPLGLGHYTGGKVDGAVPAKHKWNTTWSPYLVANEFICGTIGRFLGLPIPPFAITEPPSETPARYMFSTLHFNYEGRDLRPVLPDNCVSSLPEMCARVIVFDVLIGNADRHDHNLAVDRMDEPRDMKVFDHDCALFGANFGNEPIGIERLSALRGRLGISAGPITGGNRHCLLRSIKSAEHFRTWTDQLWELGGNYLRRICSEAQQYGISQQEATAAADFLEDRSKDVAGILNRHKEEFVAVKPWRMI